MKKILVCLLVLTLLLSSTLSFASAMALDMGQETDLNSMAKALNNLRILTGTNEGYELERELTRAEGSTIIANMAVANDHVLEDIDINIPFTDVPEWASVYVNYLYQEGAVSGISDTLFGSNDKMTAQQFTAMVLRLLEYSDKDGDFVWNKSLDKALEIGMIDKANKERIEKSETFTRGDMVLIAYNALFQNFNNRDQKLLELQATTETARGLTGLFTVDLTDAEVEEIKKPGRTWEDKFFGDDNTQFKAFEDKILNSVREALDYYEVYYNGEEYDIEVDSIGSVDELGSFGTYVSVNARVDNGIEEKKSNFDVSYKLEGNKFIPWSDEQWRSAIAKSVVTVVALDKNGFEDWVESFEISIDYANENSFDNRFHIKHNGKELEKYLVPFDNGNSKIVIQDYK